jgi:hypothetical protein
MDGLAGLGWVRHGYRRQDVPRAMESGHGGTYTLLTKTVWVGLVEYGLMRASRQAGSRTELYGAFADFVHACLV